MIKVDNKQFILSGKDYEYSFYEKDGKLIHSYYGELLGEFTNSFLVDSDKRLDKPTEFGEFGRGDYLVPSIVVRTGESLSTDFKFESYEILNKKPRIGMPQLRGEQQTLSVIMNEERLGLKLTLFYTPYEEGLCRSAKLQNYGKENIILDKMLSACFELPNGSYDTIDLCGKPMSERIYNRQTLSYGVKRLRSERGITSHQTNCFLAVMEDNAQEECGNVYGFNLIYSGNFNIECEKDIEERVRVVVGENIIYGGIELEPNQEFFTPEVVSIFSNNGIGGMSRNFHRLYRKHLLNPNFVDKIRPIVINSWESVVFNVGEKTLFEFIDGAKGLGIDMVVLDDGWFGERNDDDRSLGDWYVDKNKLPNGLKPIIDRCHDNGMKFGIWFEPEAISPNSDLYRAHPDWAIHTENSVGVQMRRQFVLDFSKKEAVDFIFESMCKILDEYEIDYVKWDMNRSLSDVPNAKKYRDFVFGVYDLYEKLTAKYPNLFIEGCASGGGRFDPAILYYSPMIWTSDDTDAWCRTKIQYSTSLCYPLQTMSNHVSKNTQLGRYIPFDTRGNIATFGCLGYELHIAREKEEHRELVKKQTAQYKEDASLILTGDLYRLRNPYTDGVFSQVVVSDDKTQAILIYAKESTTFYAQKENKLRLFGLDENKTYRINELDKIFTGKQLMNVGLEIDLGRGLYLSKIFHIKAL